MSEIDNSSKRIDHSSFSDPSIAVTKHIEIDWTIDFDKRELSGRCVHTIFMLRDAETVDFDGANLCIEDVLVSGKSVSYRVNDKSSPLGQQISVSVPKEEIVVGSTFTIEFAYSTHRTASALQWLEKEATSGKRYPYLFTQSQAIHARSLFPCMDTPGVKATYSATIHAPEWCTALMSALPVQSDSLPKGVFKWNQPVPVSSYLIALAAGDLASRDIGERVRVWSEPEIVDAAAFEFSETEEFLQTAESIAGPYVWGRYDILCLPPSFPYGGMENPCLTFATPTLLAGDKSLADVIAHEISHSWTGTDCCKITLSQ